MGMHKNKELSPAEIDQISLMMGEVVTSADFRRLQSVYLRGQGLSVEEISKIVLYSIVHIKRIWTVYFKGGIEALAVKTRGGRYRCNLSLEEEKELIAQYAQAGENGHILEIGPLHRGLCEKVGRPVAESTAYRLAHRHGWRKIAPRPRHPKQVPMAAQYFKVFFPQDH
jgi:transposase